MSANELKAGNEWSSLVSSFAHASSNTLILPFFLVAVVLYEPECNLSLAGYTNIFKCCLLPFTGNTILAQLDTLMRTSDNSVI